MGEDLLVLTEDSQSMSGMLVKYFQEPPNRKLKSEEWFKMEVFVSENDQNVVILRVFSSFFFFLMFCFSDKSFYRVLVTMTPAFLVTLFVQSLTTRERKGTIAPDCSQ